ncbi:MAG: response regulator [Pseudomonadota bacterium]|nr:response regulator [Pseudomonadota bacterium]
MTVSRPVYFLLVDDLQENLLSLDALLRREGLVLLKARSGPEALELLLTHEVALALLDVQMPAMDGFELAELMRGSERTRRVPIIFLTAGTADRDRRFRGYEAGAVDFINKPIEPDILRSKAEVFFELYRQQQQLAQQRDELRASAEENARLLKESRLYAEALKETDHRKDEFLATLAHELRNPLAPIRNGLQILRMSPAKEVSDNVREMMDRQLTHLVRLIDDLLDVSRVSQGKIDLRKEHITLQAVLQAGIEGSRPLLDTGKHRLTVDVPSEPLWLDADLTRMAQVVGNLLNNAAKYTKEGGHIQVSAKQQGQEALITVADNGVGIPADMLPKVFDLFTQVDRNLDRSQGGLGIGLALVRRLVEMHGGAITAASPGLNKGSEFTVRLPLIEKNVEAPEAPRPGEPDAVSGLKVLVVDDNIASAKTTGWMLELMGHEPTLAHDGPAALQMAREQRPDVIMLDIGLPGMNGYEVCRELRRDPVFKNTLLIAQTGWGQERDRLLAVEAGFDHHLIKPLKLENLADLLSRVGTPSAPAPQSVKTSQK